MNNSEATSAKNHVWFLRLAGVILRYLPDRARHVIPPLAGMVAYLVSPRSKRRTVRGNQRLALGSVSPYAVERSAIKAYVNYSKYWVSLLLTPKMSTLDVLSSANVVNFDILISILAEGRGALVVSAHLGNWDFGAAWFAALGGKVLAVVERLESNEMAEWFWKDRKSVGVEPIYPDADATKRILASLRENQVVALVSDRDIPGNGSVVEMFGKRIKIPVGPAVLSVRSGTMILPCAVLMSKRDEYTIVFFDPLDPASFADLSVKERVSRITQWIAARLEEMIKLDPSQWLAFVKLDEVD